MDPSVPKKEILNPLSESSQPSELTQPSEPYHEFKESKEKKLPKIIPLSAILFIFLLIIASFFATAWALAYEKVKLEKYPDFQKRISHFVQSLPLTPKTPKFLIEKTITAQQNAAKHSFDVSLAFDSDSLISSLGLAKLDLEAKGAADYSDPKNLIFDLNASISKDFKLDLKKKDAIIFFKITKFPTLLLSLAGIKEEELSPITDKWVSYDTSGLNTLARKEVDKRKEMKSLNDYLKETQEKYLDEFVLERMKTEKVREDTGTFYKISLNQSDEVLNHIGEKLIKEAEKSYQEQYKLPLPSQGAIKIKASDYIKNFKLEVFIDSNNFHTRKILLSADFKNLSPIISNIYSEEEVFGRSDNKVIKMALVAKFDDFEKYVGNIVALLNKKFEKLERELTDNFNKKFTEAEKLLQGFQILAQKTPDLDKYFNLLEEEAKKVSENKVKVEKLKEIGQDEKVEVQEKEGILSKVSNSVTGLTSKVADKFIKK